MSFYNGTVTGLSKIATGTPSAFCRAVLSGEFSVNPHNIRKKGAGAQLHVRKGTSEIRLTATVVGLDKTDLAKFFPTTSGVQVASFPGFLVEVDDGATGREFVCTSGQPGNVTVSLPEGEDSEVEYQVEMLFAACSGYAAGTYIPVYNSYKGHTINDATVTISGVSENVMSFELSNDLGASLRNPLNGKTAGAKTFAAAAIVQGNDPALSFVTADEYGVENLFADDHTPVDIVLALANGTSAENITITLDDFVPESFNMPVTGEEFEGFSHEFRPGDGVTYNRVQVA
jgi:hypothetical protein